MYQFLLTIKNENRFNLRTATPEKKGSTAIGFKNELCTLNFAIFAFWYDITPSNMQPIFK